MGYKNDLRGFSDVIFGTELDFGVKLTLGGHILNNFDNFLTVFAIFGCFWPFLTDVPLVKNYNNNLEVFSYGHFDEEFNFCIN